MHTYIHHIALHRITSHRSLSMCIYIYICITLRFVTTCYMTLHYIDTLQNVKIRPIFILLCRTQAIAFCNATRREGIRHELALLLAFQSKLNDVNENVKFRCEWTSKRKRKCCKGTIIVNITNVLLR